MLTRHHSHHAAALCPALANLPLCGPPHGRQMATTANCPGRLRSRPRKGETLAQVPQLGWNHGSQSPLQEKTLARLTV